MFPLSKLSTFNFVIVIVKNCLIANPKMNVAEQFLLIFCINSQLQLGIKSFKNKILHFKKIIFTLFNKVFYSKQTLLNF